MTFIQEIHQNDKFLIEEKLFKTFCPYRNKSFDFKTPHKYQKGGVQSSSPAGKL